MPRQKSHKGLLKRARETPRGKFKLPRAGGRHKRSHKASDLLQSYRRKTVTKLPEERRLRHMLGLPVRRKDARRHQTKPQSGS